GLERFLAAELERAQTPQGEGRAGFLRAYGNHTTLDVSREPLLADTLVAKAMTSDQIPMDAEIRVGLAVDLDPEGRQASISAAWRDAEGRAIVEVIACELGTRWAPMKVLGIHERQVNAIDCVFVNDTAVTRDLADQL